MIVDVAEVVEIKQKEIKIGRVKSLFTIRVKRMNLEILRLMGDLSGKLSLFKYYFKNIRSIELE